MVTQLSLFFYKYLSEIAKCCLQGSSLKIHVFQRGQILLLAGRSLEQPLMICQCHRLIIKRQRRAGPSFSQRTAETKKNTVSTAMQTPLPIKFQAPIMTEHSTTAFPHHVLVAARDQANRNPSSWMLCDSSQPLVYPEHLQYVSRRTLTTQELCTTLWAQIPLEQNPASS